MFTSSVLLTSQLPESTKTAMFWSPNLPLFFMLLYCGVFWSYLKILLSGKRGRGLCRRSAGILVLLTGDINIRMLSLNVLLTVHHDINFESITNLIHKYLYSYSVTILYMFQAILCSSSGGPIILIIYD